MTLQGPLIFWWHVFLKVYFLKLSTVFCMLVMFTQGGAAETAETAEIKQMCHIANLQLIVAGALFILAD